MKALELVTYPHDMHGDYAETVKGRTYIHSVEVVDVYAMTKWFADAEIAAEYWASDRMYEQEKWAGDTKRAAELDEQTYVLYRFATFPHYDEVS